jgi:DNA-binding HxlR family transcriptional regulator
VTAVWPCDSHAEECQAFEGTLESVNKRWMGAILLAGARGARRFSDYRRMVVGISDRLLSRRLKELEALQLFEREVVPSTPVQVFHRPSPRGMELLAALQPLIRWGLQYPAQGTRQDTSPAG